MKSNNELQLQVAIVKGDWEMIQQLLRELRLHFDNQSFIDQQLTTDKHSTTNISEPQELEIQQIDIQKSLIQTNSLLEFIIVSLSQHLDLKPQQAVTLLNNSHKQLNNILINGQKKSFKTIVNWLIDLSKNTTFILRFQFNMEILFSLLKAGLASKSPEVCYWTIFIYQNILQILIENQQIQLIEDCYAWFVREHSGLIATILATKKHPQFIDQICSLYGMLSSYNINDFFDVQLRKLLKSGKEYIDFINIILEPLTNRDQLAGKGMMEFFASHAFKLFDIQHSYLEKMSALKYFEQYWIYYPELFEQSVVDGYLVNVRKATRDQNNLLRIFSFVSLFRILDNLAMRKDKYASLIYKKLVFSLIENFDEKEIRDVLISNFRNLILKYSAIPIDILLIPMIKQLQIHETESMISITDFQLLKETCTHPKMELNLAIQMLDILCKLYMNSIIFHQIAFQQIQLLLSRFIESEPTREFAFNVTKIALTEYYGSFSEYIKNYPKVFLINNQDNKILQQQYRSQMIQLVRFIIHLRQFDLNEQIKNVILHFHSEIHTVLKAESKGLTMLLQYFGDVPILLEEYQQQQQQKQQSQKNSSRITSKPYHNIYNNNQLQTEINHKSDVTDLYDDPFWELKITESEQIPKSILQTISLDDDEQKLLKQFDTL